MTSADIIITTTKGGRIPITVFRCHPGCGAYWRPGHGREPSFDAPDTMCIAGELVAFGGTWPMETRQMIEDALAKAEHAD